MHAQWIGRARWACICDRGGRSKQRIGRPASSPPRCARGRRGTNINSSRAIYVLAPPPGYPARTARLFPGILGQRRGRLGALEKKTVVKQLVGVGRIRFDDNWPKKVQGE